MTISDDEVLTKFFTIEEIAMRFGVSVKDIEQLIYEDLLHVIDVNGNKRIPLVSVLNFVGPLLEEISKKGEVRRNDFLKRKNALSEILEKMS